MSINSQVAILKGANPPFDSQTPQILNLQSQPDLQSSNMSNKKSGDPYATTNYSTDDFSKSNQLCAFIRYRHRPSSCVPYIRAFADNDFRVELLKHP